MVVERRRRSDDNTIFSYTTERSFNGIDYVVSIYTLKADRLEIEIEQKCDASRWKGEFNSKYLEEITTKTGNFKKFHIFVRMLKSALQGQSRSVIVDVLTYNDLEEMRKERLGSELTDTEVTRPIGGQGLTPNNKRYLILTYASEFDRVHYPLPLAFEERPDPDRLRRVICDLRSEIESLRKSTKNEIVSPFIEHTRHNARSSMRSSNGNDLDIANLTRELKLAYKERDVLKNRLEATRLDLEQEQCNHRRSMRKNNKEIEKVTAELKCLQNELRKMEQKNKELTRQLDVFQRQGLHDRAKAPLNTRFAGRSKTRTSTPTSQRSIGRRSIDVDGRSRETRKRNGYVSSESQKSERTSVGSISSKTRFNPTAYVQQQQEKFKRIQRQKRTNSSGFGSGRDSSRESRTSSKRDSVHRSGNNSRPLSITSATHKKSHELMSGRASSVDSTPKRSQRSISPGRALQEIKEKLHKFTSNTSSKKSVEHVSPVVTEENFDDVDERLATLQQFLHAAKSSIADI